MKHHNENYHLLAKYFLTPKSTMLLYLLIMSFSWVSSNVLKENNVGLNKFLDTQFPSTGKNQFNNLDFPPIAVFHGINDSCGTLEKITKYFSDKTGAYSSCIEYGKDKESAFHSMDFLGKKACELILSDKAFEKDFILVGFSQGGLIARYILEKCQTKGRVKKLITLGSPHMGVEKIPCNSKNYDFLCDLGAKIGQYLIYLPYLENLYAPVSYFRTPETEEIYLKYNKFLADLNNEKAEKSLENKEKFLALEKLVLIKFDQDDMVFPKESAWFQKYKEKDQVEDLKESLFYQEDFLGLRTLNESERVQFITFRGKHQEMHQDEIDDYLMPAILN
jgi:palmitoyl-protein thioesterase